MRLWHSRRLGPRRSLLGPPFGSPLRSARGVVAPPAGGRCWVFCPPRHQHAGPPGHPGPRWPRGNARAVFGFVVAPTGLGPRGSCFTRIGLCGARGSAWCSTRSRTGACALAACRLRSGVGARCKAPGRPVGGARRGGLGRGARARRRRAVTIGARPGRAAGAAVVTRRGTTIVRCFSGWAHAILVRVAVALVQHGCKAGRVRARACRARAW